MGALCNHLIAGGDGGSFTILHGEYTIGGWGVIERGTYIGRAFTLGARDGGLSTPFWAIKGERVAFGVLGNGGQVAYHGSTRGEGVNIFLRTIGLGAAIRTIFS